MPEGWACRCGRGTLYDVLQVSPWCEPEVIQAAFRALARSRHPDVSRSVDAEEQMRRLNLAYQTLSDPAQRSRYDEELALEAARLPPLRPASAAGYGTGYAASSGVGAGARAATASAGAGARPGSGARATTGAGSGAPDGPSSSGAAASGQPAYQASIFDTRGNLVLPRSAIYVSVVMVVIIVVLIVMLLMDFLAEAPNTPDRPIRPPSGVLNTGRPSSSSSAPTWTFDLSGPSAEPGLSPPRTR
jgi:hypothetical protein